ncbi:MAG: DUF4905 domain-containing protein [Bacteroidota bacterium]|nr:DUF4905 domain-containing protein [Bacteroidota bacterium]MDP4194262.1 DUF4905 domain-containing protein [Bacteroidota bacterium]
MKIKQRYAFTNNRQLWRILISGTNKVIVEDRDVDHKQVFFNCLQAETGNFIFRNLQLEEKFWIGIEVIYKDIIYFHKFAKPDMPNHKEIIAFDINSQKILWKNDSYAFLFVHDDKVYTYKPKFEGRNFYALDYLSGEELESLGDDAFAINQIRNSINIEEEYKDYLFPNIFSDDTIIDIDTKQIILDLSGGFEIQGNIEFIRYKDILLFNYYAKASEKIFINRFIAVDTSKRKIIFEEILNSTANAYVPDSFFMKDNLVFLLKEKKELKVFAIE